MSNAEAVSISWYSRVAGLGAILINVININIHISKYIF